MSKRPFTIYTAESLKARTIEVGECWEWQGYAHNRMPQVQHDGKMVSVRRLFSQLLDKNYPTSGFITTTCKEQRCVNPDHFKHYTTKQFSGLIAKKSSKSVHGNHMRAIKLQQVKRLKAKLTPDQAYAIRLSTRPSREEAAIYGVDKSLICRIRRGEAWRDLSAKNNPFAALY